MPKAPVEAELHRVLSDVFESKAAQPNSVPVRTGRGCVT
jgi:hypothetical protein